MPPRCLQLYVSVFQCSSWLLHAPLLAFPLDRSSAVTGNRRSGGALLSGPYGTGVLLATRLYNRRVMITGANQRPVATLLIWMGIASMDKIPRYAIPYMLCIGIYHYIRCYITHVLNSVVYYLIKHYSVTCYVRCYKTCYVICYVHLFYNMSYHTIHNTLQDFC